MLGNENFFIEILDFDGERMVVKASDISYMSDRDTLGEKSDASVYFTEESRMDDIDISLDEYKRLLRLLVHPDRRIALADSVNKPTDGKIFQSSILGSKL